MKYGAERLEEMLPSKNASCRQEKRYKLLFAPVMKADGSDLLDEFPAL